MRMSSAVGRKKYHFGQSRQRVYNNHDPPPPPSLPGLGIPPRGLPTRLMKRFLPILCIWAVFAGPARAVDPTAAEFFEKKIRPVRAEKCYQCHGPDKQKAGLRLDSAAGIRKGGKSA